jgi:hypothetical protein
VSEPVEVQIPCICPSKPHEQDSVFLRPRLGLAGGVALQSLFKELFEESVKHKNFNSGKLSGLLTEGYLLNGIESWTLVDEAGKDLPLTDENISDKLLSDFEIASPIADKADDLYYDAVLAPLVERLNNFSTTLQTKRSTSATKRSRAKTARPRSRSTSPSSKPLTPLKQSSTSTTQTDSTGTTLVALAGGSTG